MLLINAIYFRGAWAGQFDPGRTKPADFKLPDGSKGRVPLMVRPEGEVRLALASSPADYTAIELGYGGQAFAMTIVLPPLGEDLRAFAATMDGERWNELLLSLRERRAEVELPRFRLADAKSLTTALRGLGMRDVFDPTSANLRRIYRPGGLHVNAVEQSSWIDVNEEGTEAAAVTWVGAALVSGPISIRVDRPFLFAIRERLSGTLLFIGLLEDPRS
jgi:serine protease inhibitor